MRESPADCAMPISRHVLIRAGTRTPSDRVRAGAVHGDADAHGGDRDGDDERPAAICFTSGTTGRAKAALFRVRHLRAIQHEDGTIDLPETNIHSPPDTAFCLEALCPAYVLLSTSPEPALTAAALPEPVATDSQREGPF
mgnify:CR=1 FL=1